MSECPQHQPTTPEEAEAVLDSLRGHPLFPALAELRSARQSIARMAELSAIGFGELDAFEAEWKNVLHRLERTWAKIEAAAHGRDGLQKLKSRVEGTRRRDSLLKYLCQARNSEEHSIEVIVEEQGPKIRAEGVGTTTIRIHLVAPPGYYLKAVSNRGVTYQPPTDHLGSTISNLGPIHVANLGLKFYIEAWNEAMQFVFKPKQLIVIDFEMG